MFEAPPTEIVVTASRAPEEQSDSAASVTIIDAERIERLGEPQVAPLLRLIPSVAIATSGPAGSLTEVRIRGAEANHTLLFVDGIRANDPAAGNAPRFELLNADLASRIEVVRGPQSALWGSEAIGGVVAVSGRDAADPAARSARRRGRQPRSAVRGAARTTRWQCRARPVGRRRLAAERRHRQLRRRRRARRLSQSRGARLRAGYRLSPGVELGASGFALRRAKASSTASIPSPSVPAHDTLDATAQQARRGAAVGRSRDARERLCDRRRSRSLLGSSNRNLLDGDPVNRTAATRRTLGGSSKLGRSLRQASADRRASSIEREKFHARDTAFSAASPIRTARAAITSATVEWRADDLGPVSADLAVRHDSFNALQGCDHPARFGPGRAGQRSIASQRSYGEGIAQPTFFDLYGFFPGFFVGNPILKPEELARVGDLAALSPRPTWRAR